MPKPITKSSWIGKAAYEIGVTTGRDGSAAHLEATRMAAELADYGIDLANVDPREYARGRHGHRTPAYRFANDNTETMPMRLSLWGDSYIYQLTIYEDGEDDEVGPLDGLEVRVPIDFLRGVREAKEDGTPWRDGLGSSIVRVGNITIVGLVGRCGTTGVRLEIDELNMMHLELALSTALNNGYQSEECNLFRGSWVSLEQHHADIRRAA